MPAKIFLNVLTVSEAWQADPISTLEKAAGMGYEGTEFGLDLPQGALRAIGKKSEELGLSVVGSHVRLDDMAADGERYFADMAMLGIRCLAIPWLDEDCLPGGARYAATKDAIRRLLDGCAQKGVALCYHNHNFEFEKLGGVCKWDVLMQDIPELKAQLDVCWCAAGGQNPAEYVRHYGHRMPTLHLKDYAANRDTAGAKLFELLGQDGAAEAQATRERYGFRFAPVGSGTVGFPEILEAAGAAGIQWLGVEQDASPDRPQLEAARMSIDYLRGQLGRAR
jgi:sugar phosphate isomerase/epimerase